jgi:2,4-dienoyl-CoA reductase-like NADH-dependent reductase (Old Yellow Enzyme family)
VLYVPSGRRSISTGSRIHRCNRIACGRRGPSAVRPEGKAFVEKERDEGELVPPVTPRALQLEEMPHLVDQSSVLRSAVKAGGDGVEVHGANSYLLDPVPMHENEPARR